MSIVLHPELRRSDSSRRKLESRRAGTRPSSYSSNKNWNNVVAVTSLAAILAIVVYMLLCG
jgi:hypothetical protein